MRYRENAICIRATDYSETSQVLHFLTRGQGVARLLAKGTKRPKSKSGGMIDLLAEGDLVYSSSGRDTLGTLMEFSESAVRGLMRRDERRLNAALYMIEIAGEMLAEGDPHPQAFDLLHNSLARLDQEGSPVAAVLAYFQWRLLQHAGLLGEFDMCVMCGVTTDKEKGRQGEGEKKTAAANGASPLLYFSSQHGGIVCAACAGSVGQKYRLDATTLAAIAILEAAAAGKRTVLPDDHAGAANRLLAYHISHQLGKTLKMARHVM